MEAVGARSLLQSTAGAAGTGVETGVGAGGCFRAPSGNKKTAAGAALPTRTPQNTAAPQRHTSMAGSRNASHPASDSIRQRRSLVREQRLPSSRMCEDSYFSGTIMSSQ
ncbi:hypothetical protein NDU88_010631 [Pleurodeles waltl]|uniref:Uncharacterized protein n=1 Tax=Pleurodeles waltl TaxID=8319 RepID=A0AAV7RYS4_PLEWA|nr:hypothetical protein NDU88_010631 [Pleurodeles waltl]